MEPIVARKTWRTLEPIHGMVYFAPEAAAAYQGIGLAGRSAYFASRSAPLGAASAEVVIATFFNFDPSLVRGAMEGVWSQTSPAEVLEARLGAASAALSRAWAGIDALVIAESAALARRAAEIACNDLAGRPLFAGHAALPWPTEPEAQLWHAQTLLREYRGDAHVAALLADGLSGIEALVTHAASSEVPRAALQTTRAWADADWEAAVAGLVTRGYVNVDGSFTEFGRERRQWVEDRTDALSTAPYAALGDDGCQRLRTIARPLSKAIVDAGLLTP